MSTSTSDPDSPSPKLIYTALEAHLNPYPILSYLPTVLNLFAHFQLLSNQIQNESIRALNTHAELRKKFERYGYNDKEQVDNGALSVRDGNSIVGIQRDRKSAEGKMLAFSLEFRKHHIATLLSTPKILIGQVERILDSYFPHLEGNDLDIIENHKSLYIRCMTYEQISIFIHYERLVRGWYNRAKELKDNNEPPLMYTDFYPEDKDNGKSKQESLCKNLLREAGKILEDMGILQEIFADNPEQDMDMNDQIPSIEGESLDESNRLTKEEKGKGRELGNGEERDRKRDQAVMDSTIKRRTTRSPSVQITTQPPNPPLSEPRDRRKFTEPYIQKSPTHGQFHDKFPSVGVTDLTTASLPQPRPLQQSHPTSSPIARPVTQLNDRRKTLPSGMIPPIPTQSPITKKKPRQSYPSTGPEYTTPLKVIDNIKKEKLRPFENSDLHRGKRAKV